MCNPGKQIISKKTDALAPLIIYKTTRDYSNNIPVVLNDTKDKIISYPAISDIYLNGEFAKPNNLSNDFMLDNIGIFPGSVFTSYTFEEYSKLDNIPTLKEFTDRIIDKDPITEMYNCGKRTDFETTAELNNLIKNNLNKCIRIK